MEKFKQNLVDFFENINRCISNYLKRENLKWHAKQLHEQEAIKNVYFKNMLFELREVLYDILSHTRISPCVSAINDKEMIIPLRGKEFRGHPIFIYTIPKVSYDNLIPTILNNIIDSINNAIRAREREIEAHACSLEDSMIKSYYLSQNYLICNGIIALGAKDCGGSVMIAIMIR